MAELAAAALGPWANFYVMVGSSSAALTGLMFVVITLVKSEQRTQATGDGIATFSTPTVLHFGTALLVSAIVEAPWRSLVHAGAAIALIGLWGIVYAVRVMHRTRRLSTYQADVEDWVFFSVLPLLAYAALFAGGIAVAAIPGALFAVAGGVVLLVFIGIRNAWDVVTYVVIGPGRE